MNWEIGVDTYKLSICCIKQIINENLLHSTGNPTQCSCELNGGGGNLEKRGFIADSLCCMAETNIVE